MTSRRAKFWKQYPEYVKAFDECRKVGTAHATGNSLCAMYASLIVFHHGWGEKFAPLFYVQLNQCSDDDAIGEKARLWLRNEFEASKVAFGGVL